MKKLVSLFLSVILSAFCCVGTLANSPVDSDKNFMPTSNVTLATPRYTHVSYVGAKIVETTLGFVRCTATAACMFDNYTFVLTCTLQRTNGSTGWTNYKTETETFTELGENIVYDTWYAPAGYTYRTHTEIVIKNSRTGKVVETATADSPFIYR